MTRDFEKELEQALAGRQSTAQCKAIYKRCKGYRGCMLQSILSLLGMTMAMLLLTFLKPELPAGLYFIVYFITMFSVLFAISIPMGRNDQRVAARIMSALSQQGIRPHLCLNCEYDLKGSTSDHCPECGTALAPVVEEENEASPRL